MTVGYGFQSCLEIGERLYAVDLCGGNERGDAGPGSPALVMTGEERILAGQGDRPDQVLDAVGVDLDPTIVQKV